MIKSLYRLKNEDKTLILYKLISSKFYTDFDEIFDIIFEDHEFEK